MKYLDPRFTVTPGTSEEYRKNYDSIFKEKEEKLPDERACPGRVFRYCCLTGSCDHINRQGCLEAAIPSDSDRCEKCALEQRGANCYGNFCQDCCVSLGGSCYQDGT